MTILRQASAEHLQQCVEFPLLRNRGLGPLAVTVLRVRTASAIFAKRYRRCSQHYALARGAMLADDADGRADIGQSEWLEQQRRVSARPASDPPSPCCRRRSRPRNSARRQSRWTGRWIGPRFSPAFWCSSLPGLSGWDGAKYRTLASCNAHTLVLCPAGSPPQPTENCLPTRAPQPWTKHLCAWGRVTYVDGFGKERWTNFCHRYPTEVKEAKSGGGYLIRKKYGRHHEHGNDAN